ncbi:hypothetical protein ACP4OV_026539 [Aristida adscensionis]
MAAGQPPAKPNQQYLVKLFLLISSIPSLRKRKEKNHSFHPLLLVSVLHPLKAHVPTGLLTLAEREGERERGVSLHGLWRQRSSLNMDVVVVDHSDDEEEQSRSRCVVTSSGRAGSRFGARQPKRRPGTAGHQQLLLMDCVGGDGDGAAEDTVPLPDYERLPQPARLPDDDPDPKTAPQPTPVKKGASPPQPPPAAAPATTQRQKTAAWRLIEYVRSRHRSGAAGGGGAGSDGDSRSSEDGEGGCGDAGEEGKKDKKKKKRSSWLPDPDRRWPVQGF